MTYRWAAEHLGIDVIDDGRGVRSLPGLVGVAVRRNPRRAHLLVSTVLGKHIPVDPRRVHAAGSELGELVRAALPSSSGVVVLGYAETATGLGHLVAEALAAPYVHSTRRDAGVASELSFVEEHSHATAHRVLPDDPDLLRRDGTVVLVDDELTSGRTVLNTIAALRAAGSRQRYVDAALVDVRDEAARAAFDDAARELDVPVQVVALASGRVDVPDSARTSALALAESVAPAVPASHPIADAPARISHWPAGVPTGGRHGFAPAAAERARAAARASAAGAARRLVGDRILVLGTEELMYAPLLIALELQDAVPTGQVRFSSTSRSPVVAIDEPGYPIRTALAFPSTDDSADEPGMRFAYNVVPAAGDPEFTDVVLVVDDAADSPALWAPDGLVAQLAARAAVHVVVVPAGAHRAAVLR